MTRSQGWGLILLANMVVMIGLAQFDIGDFALTVLNGGQILVIAAMPWPRPLEQIGQEVAKHLDRRMLMLCRIGVAIVLLLAIVGLGTVLLAFERAFDWSVDVTLPLLLTVSGLALLIFGRNIQPRET